MDILFKPRVDATERMIQNWTFRNPRIKESAKSRLGNMYVVVISILRPKTKAEVTYTCKKWHLCFSGCS